MVLVPEEEYFHGAVPRQKAEGALIASKHDGEPQRAGKRKKEREREREKDEAKEKC